ncbi:unnamed protein product [Cuscuta campestris]|uniref:Pentacotripeptide-repeat region of PRORP domain-containing protein n=1 Tax=Cuscuta campestris TaxID=132261 RepID=A0A484KK15_9ASTE|nr:unnamed protein product [Cuscuta campestris]
MMVFKKQLDLRFQFQLTTLLATGNPIKHISFSSDPSVAPSDMLAQKLDSQLKSSLSSKHCPNSVIVEAVHLFEHAVVDLMQVPFASTCNFLIETLVKNKAYGLAFDVYGKITCTLNRAQFTPRFLTLAALVEIFVHTHKPDLAFSVFGIILKRGFVINVYLLNMLLKGFCENGMVDKGVELLCESEGNPMVSPDRVSYNTLIKGLCNANRLLEALELRAGMETANLTPDLLTYTILMDGFFRDDKVDEAMGLLEEMKIKGLEPDVFTYSTLVNGLCGKGMVDRGKELFDEMLVQGVSPNVVTYTSLINGFCKKGQLKETMVIFNSMLECGVKPDTVTFTSIIDGLCKDGKVDKALQVFNLMLGKGLGLGNTTYNVLIRGLCTKGLLTDAYNILQVMIEKGEKPNVVTFNTIMMGLCDHGKVDDALSLFNSMCTEKDYAEPDVRTVTLLVHALCQKKRTCQAAEIHEKMMIKNKHLVDVQTFTVLIGAHLKEEGDVGKAMCTWKKMTELGFIPDSLSYGTLIDGFCKLNMLNIAKGIFLTMRNRRVFDYNSVMAALCKESSIGQAKGLFQEMLNDRECKPDSVTYNIIIDAALKAGDLQLAEQLLTHMLQEGLKPDAFTFSILISRFSNLGQTEVAKNLFDKMVASGFTPDILVYDSLLKGLSLKEGKSDEILRLLHEMSDKGIVLDSKITSTILRYLSDTPEALHLVELLPNFPRQQSKEIFVPNFPKLWSCSA